MNAPASPDRVIRIWLLIAAALVALMVLVGGATRLTDSGLSITEWKPVTGTLPPLSDEAWQAEFEKYKQIPQYQLLNKGMELAAFKSIFWWEWGHRLLGRIIGAVMLLPFVFFVVTGRLRGTLAWKIFGIGLFIGVQGTIGWIMVASGLKPGMTAVAPTRLALHLVCALLIFVMLLFTAFGLGRAPAKANPLKGTAYGVLVLLFVQITLGALVAGNDAGLAYNTWPLMDGGIAPASSALLARPVFIENFVDNVALVQFNHRIGAYLLLIFALWHAMRAKAFGAPAEKRQAVGIAHVLLIQAAIGIATLLLMVPVPLALLHQAMALLLLFLLSRHIAQLRYS
jgi:cytochrome c oxidase assembly protein subunit 15